MKIGRRRWGPSGPGSDRARQRKRLAGAVMPVTLPHAMGCVDFLGFFWPIGEVRRAGEATSWGVRAIQFQRQHKARLGFLQSAAFGHVTCFGLDRRLNSERGRAPNCRRNCAPRPYGRQWRTRRFFDCWSFGRSGGFGQKVDQCWCKEPNGRTPTTCASGGGRKRNQHKTPTNGPRRPNYFQAAQSLPGSS